LGNSSAKHLTGKSTQATVFFQDLANWHLRGRACFF